MDGTEAVRSPLRSRSFLGVLGTAFAVALGFGLIVPALPIFARDLGASYSSTSAVVAVFAGVRLIASAPAGWLTDRIGARNVVAGGLVIVAVSSALTAGADSVGELLTLRGAGGIGSAMFITAMMQHVLLTVPASRRGRAIALVQGSFLLGGASGPAVGGLVIAALGVRAPFLVYAGTLALATVISLTFLDRHEPPGPATRPATSTVAAGDPEAELAPVATAVVSGGGRRGVVRELLADRTFVVSLVLGLAVNWASQGMRFFAVPVFAEEALGADPAGIGLALTVASLAHAAVLYPASQVMDGRGRRVNARVGSLLYVVAVLGLVTVTGFGGLLAWLLLQGVATGVVSGVPAAVVGDLAPPEAAGRAVGILGVARDIGSVVGVQMTGILVDRVGFDAAFVVAAGLLAVGAVGAFVMRETLELDTGGPAGPTGQVGSRDGRN